LAAAALVGCSNDDDLTSTDRGGEDLNTDGCGYIAVNIVQPTSVAGRSTRADGFENGSETENFAEEGLFFIFSEDGNTMYSNARRIPLTATGDTGTQPAVEQIYKAVLVIDGAADNPIAENETKQIVCVLNAPAELENGITQLAQLEEKIADYCTGYTTKGKFIMTNSVYMEATSETDLTLAKVLGAKITKDQIFTSAAQAQKNPVDIFVERAVAKVEISPNSAFENKGTGSQTVDGVENTGYTIKVTGLSIANIADQAYLFKNITDIGTDDASAWIWDPLNKRSYWETVSLAATNFKNQSYNTIYGQWNTDAEGETEATSFDIKGFTFTPAYILPNTSAQKTAVLVTAQLMDGDGAEAQPVELIYLRGGYFAQDNAMDVIAEYVKQKGYYKGKLVDGSTTDMEYSSLVPDDFEWTNKYVPAGETDEKRIPWIEDFEAVAKVTPAKMTGYEIYTKNGSDYTKVENGTDEIDNLLRGTAEAKSAYTAWVWKEGRCYYYVNIDQSSLAGSEVSAHTYDGVVRNHIYKLTLNSITGLGTPVFDPTIDIIPQKPEKDEDLYYLAATINVLSWKIVTQGVDFN